MATKEEVEELKKIRQQSNNPEDEEKIVPLVSNKKQLKIAIPKKFVDISKINKKKNKVKFTLLKKERKLLMEIINVEE
jgi:hypothetical protein